MRRVLLLALLSLGLPTVAVLTHGGAAGAGNRPPVDAELIARMHERHGHSQYQHGQGTPGHTWVAYRRQARALRTYLQRVERAAQRRALVSRWQGVAQCESGGNWSINTGNGHYGGLQFSMGTWQAYGGQGMPHHQPAWRQAKIAERVRVSSGLGHWPRCGSRYAG